MDVLPGVPGLPPTGSGVETTGSASVLIMTQPGLIASAVQHHADAHNTQEIYIDVATAETTEELIDDTLWPSKMKKLEEQIKHHGASGGIFVHSGVQGAGARASKDKSTRLAAALLIRMMAIISLLISSGRLYFFVVQWPREADEDIRKHGLAKAISNHGS